MSHYQAVEILGVNVKERKCVAGYWVGFTITQNLSMKGQFAQLVKEALRALDSRHVVCSSDQIWWRTVDLSVLNWWERILKKIFFSNFRGKISVRKIFLMNLYENKWERQITIFSKNALIRPA